ncbi:uncharacterized protein LOC126747251 isoform X2 [Anthonomus grandis grandis]|uniref:uncharacterized protein LOC126747251 isoform X2 n=1 Tax=Anthonomus grandis grandis TaxID=2921223 RepID=UPI002165395C|nr:uncharacterized protein LOC126747251 isoform X2 [Anthonomus grandis grandis]
MYVQFLFIMGCFFVVCAKGPSEIDKLRTDFCYIKSAHYIVPNKRILLQKFYEFDQKNIQPGSTDYWCNNGNDTYSRLFQIYHAVAIAEFKIYFMLCLQDVLIGKSIGDMKALLETKKIFINITKGATIDIRRCDPYKFIRETNYLHFTKLLQGFLNNIYDDKMTQGKLKNQCTGDKTIECMTVSSSGKVCISSFKYRRYDFILQNKQFMGKRQYCSQSKLKKWNGKNELCVCDAFGAKSDRYISIRMSSSNILENYVITGLRFKKSKRVLHLQIQEGRLLSDGIIQENSIHWVPLKDFKITDDGIYNDIDMYSLTNRNRTMAIDEFKIEEDNHAITGIGFQLIEGKLQLVATVTKYNSSTYKLNITEAKNIYNKSLNRTDLTPKEADIPIYTDKNSEILSNGPSFLNFTNTDINKDVAQTTIPFFDAQEVTNRPARPLVGAGLYYKGRKGYGGFIAPMIKIAINL